MPNILILEDEKIYAQEITRMVLDVFPSANLMIFPCVPSTLPIIPDLAILDIELEGSKDGIQFMHEYGKQIPAILFYSVCFTRIKESFGINVLGFVEKGEDDSVLKEKLGQFTRNYTQTVKRAADNKRRYAPGWVHSTCLLRGFPKGAAPHLAHDFAEQSVVCYTLCRRCPENTVAAGEGKGI